MKISKTDCEFLVLEALTLVEGEITTEEKDPVRKYVMKVIKFARQLREQQSEEPPSQPLEVPVGREYTEAEVIILNCPIPWIDGNHMSDDTRYQEWLAEFFPFAKKLQAEAYETVVTFTPRKVPEDQITFIHGMDVWQLWRVMEVLAQATGGEQLIIGIPDFIGGKNKRLRQVTLDLTVKEIE